MVFEDRQSMDENSAPVEDEDMSWYEEKSNECSPSIRRHSALTTALREGSVNQQSQPPLNSFLAKQKVRRHTAHANLQSDNIEQSRHIEHLESQLVAAHAKIESLTSPKTNKMRSARLRSLAAENRNLRTENATWAGKVEELVEQERSRHADTEIEMRLQVQALEEDVEVKDARIAESQWELESMRVQVKDAEGLEEANATLERKIDMLSSLLVNSPDKQASHSPATSPRKSSVRFSPSKRTYRPGSVLSRVSTSPTGKRLSLASVSEAAFWESRSCSTSVVEPLEDAHVSESRNERALSPTPSGGMFSPVSSKRLSYSDSNEDHTNSSSFGTRTGTSSSRPTSFMSTSSAGAPSWGVPMLPDGESRFSSRQRRMRKFPSGSSTLKPLILPVASTTNVQSLPASATMYPSIESIASRDVSGSSSAEPSASFMSALADDYQPTTPTVLSREESAQMERERTLNALEGKTRPVSHEERGVGLETRVASACSSGSQRISARPQSLQKELEQAEVEQAHLNALGISAPDAFEDGLVPESSNRSTYHHSRDLSPCNTMSQDCSVSMDGDDLNTPPTPKASNLRYSASHHPQSLFSRVTDIISQTKQDPFVLARRILANAWTLGSASMGGIGWWLIGPLHHHQQRYQALEGNGNANPHYSAGGRRRVKRRGHGSWQHFSAEIRNGRVVNTESSSHYGSTWMAPNRSTGHGMRDEDNSGLPFFPESSRGEPHLFPCDECTEPSSRRTLRLWFQFSLTVVLAVGLAVRYGPSALLADPSSSSSSSSAAGEEHDAANGPALDDTTKESDEQQVRRRRRHQRITSQGDVYGGAFSLDAGGVVDKGEHPSKFSDTRDGADSGYGSIAFAETLGPADFEAG